MGTLIASAVTTRIATLLQDAGSVRWPLAELYLWISDAQREIASYKPDALAKTAMMTLVAGTRQSLPEDGTVLIDVVRTGGGRAPRRVERRLLDAQTPNWHTAATSAEVLHYMFDPAIQKTYYVYPPQPASGQGTLEIVYAAAPVDVTSAGQSLVLDDTWLPMITNYVMYRAYSKDAEHAANANLAVAYYQAFTGQMTGKSTAKSMLNPNVRSVSAPTPMAG